MRYITKIKAVEKFIITIEFDNKEERMVDFFAFLDLGKISHSSLLYKLNDLNYFKKVELDSYGTLSWNNEIDFCPDVLYQIGSKS